MFITLGGAYTGGFTLNAGTVVARGQNAMGNGGLLTINGGTIAANATRDFGTSYTNIVVGGDFTLGSSVSPAVATSNLTFGASPISLGDNTSRTITIGGTGTYSFSGQISGINSNLTIAGTGGVVELRGINTYSGTTTVSGGTLNLNRTGNPTLPVGNTVVVNSGATLRILKLQTLANVTVDAGGTLILDAALTVTANCNINGTVRINQFGSFASVPTYGPASTLIYNQTQSTANEWTGGGLTTVAAGIGIPANVSILEPRTLSLSGDRGVPGNIHMVGGSDLNLNVGDLYVGGNFTRDGGSIIANGKAVIFIGTGISEIYSLLGFVTFGSIIINKPAGTVRIGNNTGIGLYGGPGNVLQILNAGTLDLNGRQVNIELGGSILVDGTVGGTTKSIMSSGGAATIGIYDTTTVASAATGTLSTDANIK